MVDREDSRRHLPQMPDLPLSPCPFCGSGDVRFYEHVYAQQFAAMCHACGAEGPRRQTYQDAGRLWNCRTPG